MRRFLSAKHIPLLTTLTVCVLLYTVAAVAYKGFASVSVLINFFVDNSFLGIVATGMTFVIISGGIDLSVGAVMALCTVVMAVLIGKCGLHPASAMLICLAVGTVFGLAMGSVIRYFKLAPFIVTLAGMFLARGLAYIVHIEPLSIHGSLFSTISNSGVRILGTQIPITAIIFIIALATGVYILGYTRFGRNVYAIGGNEQAAVLMGLPVDRTKMMVYLLSGLCSALAAVVFTFYQSCGDPNAGTGLELDAIAVVVIGGTLLSGGAGHLMGTLAGVLIFGIIQTGITFQGTLSSWWTKVAVGVLLLIFIALQKVLGSGGRRGRQAGKVPAA
jgi:simple sugar transport system permease protein